MRDSCRQGLLVLLMMWRTGRSSGQWMRFVPVCALAASTGTLTRPTTTRNGVEPRTRATNGTGIPSAGARRPPGANRTTTAAPVKGGGFSMPKLIVSTKGDALNRLAISPRDNWGAIVIVIDHLQYTIQAEITTYIDNLDV